MSNSDCKPCAVKEVARVADFNRLKWWRDFEKAIKLMFANHIATGLRDTQILSASRVSSERHLLEVVVEL